MAEVQTEPRGTIRVVCPVTLAQTVLGDVLPIYLARHPQVQLEMEVNNRVVDLVEEGVDVALRVRLTLEESGQSGDQAAGRGTLRAGGQPPAARAPGHDR